jgi:hypoxanthine phosphoribosyltransferase
MPDLPGYVTQNEKNLTDLKTEKAALAAEGFPNRKTGLLVLKYWKWAIKLPENSVLYVAPSTTGENKLPSMIARKIQRENPTAEIIQDFARAEHVTRSAQKTALEKLADPVKWTLNKDLEPTGKPAYIVDDVVTTGESVRALREVLAERGIPIHGCISLQQSDRSAMYESDFKRMIPKLGEAPGIEADLREMMKGHSRRRAGVLESVLKYSNDKEKNEITNYIRSEAKRIREFDPRKRRILGEFGGANHQLQQRGSTKTRDSQER